MLLLLLLWGSGLQQAQEGGAALLDQASPQGEAHLAVLGNDFLLPNAVTALRPEGCGSDGCGKEALHTPDTAFLGH